MGKKTGNSDKNSRSGEQEKGLRLIAVSSSNIAKAGYDPRTETLYIVFHKTGATYAYEGVPEDVVGDFMAADSHGKFFHSEIRDQYPAAEIATPDWMTKRMPPQKGAD